MKLKTRNQKLETKNQTPTDENRQPTTTFSTLLMNPDQILNGVKTLPPAPQVACKLLRLLKHNLHDSQEVVKTIQYDSALTAKLLKTCNSAFWSSRAVDPTEPVESIGSLEQAIFKLGHNEILRLVITLTIGKSLITKLDGYAMEAQSLWRHSVTTAVAAQKLSKSYPMTSDDESVAFTAGLLHDIGKLVANQFLIKRAPSILELIKKDPLGITEMERKILGVDHAEIGGRLLERWNLPPEIVEAVTYHHHPLLHGSIKLSAVIHIANQCAHLAGSPVGWVSFSARLEPKILEALKLKRETIERLLQDISEETARIEAFISVV